VRPSRARLVVFAVITAVVVAFAIAVMTVTDRMVAQCHADPAIVQVDPGVENANRIAERITEQIADDDEIAVLVTDDESQRNLLGHYLNDYYTDRVLLLVIGTDVWARGNYWVPQVVLDDRLDKVKNVNRNPIDQVVSMIGAIHQWQSVNRKPAPPPPPAPPPGPPPPPAKPFHMPWEGWVGIGFGVLFAIWLPLELRRRRRIAVIARRADEQADWGVDKYGIKTNLD
jgi:hypothetical protein